VGKTTFIRHLISSDPAAFKDTAIAIYIDFGFSGTLSGDLKAYILEQIDKQLLEIHQIDTQEDGFVRRVHGYELERFEKGIYKQLKNTKPSL